METTLGVSRSPLPDDIMDYMGRWVLLFDGEVVDEKDSREEIEQLDRRDESLIFHVTPSRFGCF